MVGRWGCTVANYLVQIEGFLFSAAGVVGMDVR